MTQTTQAFCKPPTKIELMQGVEALDLELDPSADANQMMVAIVKKLIEDDRDSSAVNSCVIEDYRELFLVGETLFSRYIACCDPQAIVRKVSKMLVTHYSLVSRAEWYPAHKHIFFRLLETVICGGDEIVSLDDATPELVADSLGLTRDVVEYWTNDKAGFSRFESIVGLYCDPLGNIDLKDLSYQELQVVDCRPDSESAIISHIEYVIAEA